MLLFVIVGCAQVPAIQVRAVSLETPDGLARGLMAVVELAQVDIVVSSGDEQTAVNSRFPLQTTFDFARETDSDLAFNANYFGDIREGHAMVLGLVIADGVVINEPRKYGDDFDPAFLTFKGFSFVYPNSMIKVASTIPTTMPDELQRGATFGSADAVAGIGPSASDSDPGTLLIAGGENLGATARTVPSERNPRTAIGVTRDGSLLIVVIDGRQPGHSVGVTLPELADWMIKQGVTDAVNLDGGGSSSFVYRNPDGSLRTNRPSDGDFRPVAVSVGIRGKAD